VDWLARLSPHGLGNPEPLFVTRHVHVMRYPRKVGRNHLKIRVREPGGDGRVVDAIGFNLGEYAERLEAVQAPRIDLAYVPERNTWNGRDSLQLRIRDLHSVSE
jgi:single-stranded-DNA-specific exonuclease